MANVKLIQFGAEKALQGEKGAEEQKSRIMFWRPVFPGISFN